MRKTGILLIVLCFLFVGMVGPVSANDDTMLCMVDIGDPESEADHNLQGWGPIEPWIHRYIAQDPWRFEATYPSSGDDCRVIWGYEENTPCATLTLDHHLAEDFEGVAKYIRIIFLDGIHYFGAISDDSFTLEAKIHGAPDEDYQLLFTWIGQFSREWKDVMIPLPEDLQTGDDLDIRLCATAPAWEHFASDMGQVAFDYIYLYGGEDEGGEGLTPGFWKNHPEEWANTAYSPDDLFSDVFGVGPAVTLMEAADTGGGDADALDRHAVAALLNASHPDVDYPMTEAEVIAAVQDAYASGEYEDTKDEFESYNETDFELYD
jgi:hypothetical protein